jgi:hypothetical protein
MTLHSTLSHLSASATPGPWTREGTNIDGQGIGSCGGVLSFTGFPIEQRRVNAELIVALRNNLPAILAALKVVEAARAMAEWRSLDWEDAASLFYKDTGHLRPGKDDARNVDNHEERASAWRAWSSCKTAERDGALIAALAAFDSVSVSVSGKGEA